MTLASHIAIGYRLPAHATAMGRVLLGGMADTEIVRLYDGCTLDPVGPETPTTLAKLLDEVAETRDAGWTINVGAFVPGMIAIAAPVYDLKGEVVAAINLSGPAGAAEAPEARARLIENLLAAAEGISRQLGWAPVITSYSIHYTKLYDGAARRRTSPSGRRRRGRCPC